jgi:hypothetical protein
MKKQICLILCLSFWFASNNSFGRIDQFNNTFSDWHDMPSVGQSFKANLTGELIGVWIYARPQYATSDVWQLSIHNFDGERLKEKVTEGQFQENQLPSGGGWFYIELSSPYLQTQGQELAFTIIPVDGSFGIEGGWIDFGAYGDAYDYYPSGLAGYIELEQIVVPNNWLKRDYTFQTVVDSPSLPIALTEPSIIEVSVVNRFGRSVKRIEVDASNEATGEIVSWTSASGPQALPYREGGSWSLVATEESLRNMGYTEADELFVSGRNDGTTEVELVIANTEERAIPEFVWFLDSFTNQYYPGILFHKFKTVSIRNPEPETLYIVEICKPQGQWYNRGSSYLDEPRPSNWPSLSIYINLLTSEPSSWLRIRAVSPD